MFKLENFDKNQKQNHHIRKQEIVDQAFIKESEQGLDTSLIFYILICIKFLKIIFTRPSLTRTHVREGLEIICKVSMIIAVINI